MFCTVAVRVVFLKRMKNGGIIKIKNEHESAEDQTDEKREREWERELKKNQY